MITKKAKFKIVSNSEWEKQANIFMNELAVRVVVDLKNDTLYIPEYDVERINTIMFLDPIKPREKL